MGKELGKIIRYFFSHDVSDGLRKRVYKRITMPGETDAVTDEMRKIWDDQNNALMDDDSIEEAYSDLSVRLGLDDGKKKTFNIKKILRIAAIWIIPLLVLGLSINEYISYDAQQKLLSEVVMRQRFTAMGEDAIVALPDGSKVHLNSGSILLYPSRFASKERKVYLSGEAFFEVTKDKTHPFIVNTQYLRMKVLGTKFNVSAYPADKKAQTTLKTGRVEVTVETTNKKYILNPNDQLTYTCGNNSTVLSKVKTSYYTEWSAGSLSINDEPLSTVIEKLERYYNVKIILTTSRYNNQRIIAHFNKKESLVNVMKIIKALIPGMEYDIQKDKVTIR